MQTTNDSELDTLRGWAYKITRRLGLSFTADENELSQVVALSYLRSRDRRKAFRAVFHYARRNFRRTVETVELLDDLFYRVKTGEAQVNRNFEDLLLEIEPVDRKAWRNLASEVNATLALDYKPKEITKRVNALRDKGYAMAYNGAETEGKTVMAEAFETSLTVKTSYGPVENGEIDWSYNTELDTKKAYNKNHK